MNGAPCSWPIVGNDDCDALPASGIGDQIKAAAVSYLWNWTGRVFGLCEMTVRPCRSDCQQRSGFGWYGTGISPALSDLVDGTWINVVCTAGCTSGCECSTVERVRLPGPVYEVSEVMIDGVVLDPGAYRVDDRRFLVRDDGGAWPSCQALDLPAGVEGTWSVTYSWGQPVPAGGQIAAGELACEMAKAAVGDESCGLPQRIQTVTREGVTVGILDPFDGLENGKTGLWLVDSWIESLRKPAPRSTVTSPDTRRPTVTTYRGVSP